VSGQEAALGALGTSEGGKRAAIQRFVFVAVRSDDPPLAHSFCPFAGPMYPARLRPRGRASAGHVGDDGAEVPLVENVVPSTSPLYARNAPRSRRKTRRRQRKALPHAQLLSEDLFVLLCYSAAAG
jgi:hypothetical protein